MRLPIRCGASLPFWVALTAAAGVLTACSSGGVSGESPPPVICGVNLAGGDVLPQIVNATSGDQDLHVQTVPAVVFLRFTGNCDSGVALNFVPAGSVTVVSSAIANDSRIVAAQLRVSRIPAEIDIKRPDGTTSVVTIRPDS